MKYLYLVLALILGTYDAVGSATGGSTLSSSGEKPEEQAMPPASVRRDEPSDATQVGRGKAQRRQRQGSRSQSETPSSELRPESGSRNRSLSVGTLNKGQKTITDFFSPEASGSSVAKSGGRPSASSSGKGSPEHKKQREIVKRSKKSASTSPLASPSVVTRPTASSFRFFQGTNDDEIFCIPAFIQPFFVDDWNRKGLPKVVEEMLPPEAFGRRGRSPTAIDGAKVVENMCECFHIRKVLEGKDDEEKKKIFEQFQVAQENKEKFKCAFTGVIGRTAGAPHIAVMRVVIDIIDGQRYIFSIPYIFASRMKSQNAIRTWENVEQQHMPNLYDAINKVQTVSGARPPINTIVKCIEDFSFTTSNPGDFAHSERAAILCLLYDPIYSLKNIIKYIQKSEFSHILEGNKIKQVTIQIKVIHPEGACEHCKAFLNGKSLCMFSPTGSSFVKTKTKGVEEFDFYQQLQTIVWPDMAADGTREIHVIVSRPDGTCEEFPKGTKK